MKEHDLLSGKFQDASLIFSEKKTTKINSQMMEFFQSEPDKEPQKSRVKKTKTEKPEGHNNIEQCIEDPTKWEKFTSFLEQKEEQKR